MIGNCSLSTQAYSTSAVSGGKAVVTYTDHKPLTFCTFNISEPWLNHQQRQISHISEYTTDIQHLQGKDNLVMYKSRATIDGVQLSINYTDMAAAQQQTMTCKLTALPTQAFKINRGGKPDTTCISVDKFKAAPDATSSKTSSNYHCRIPHHRTTKVHPTHHGTFAPIQDV